MIISRFGLVIALSAFVAATAPAEEFAEYCHRSDLTSAQRDTVMAILAATTRAERTVENCAAAQSILLVKKRLRGVTDQQGKGLTDLTPFKTLPYLQELSLSTGVADLFPLASLENLTSLELWGYGPDGRGADLSPLSRLKNLVTLQLGEWGIRSLQGLGRLPKLEVLLLKTATLESLDGIEGLTALKKLRVENWPLRGKLTLLSPLASLTGLSEISLPTQRISSLRGLEGLSALSTLDLVDNEIESLESLGDKPLLRRADLQRNHLTALGGLEGATSLESLNVGENRIARLSGIETLVSLRSLQIYKNEIADLAELGALSNLAVLGANDNRISSLGPLARLTQLIAVDVTGNAVSDLAPLTGIKLVILRAGRTRVSSIEALKDDSDLQTLVLPAGASIDLKPVDHFLPRHLNSRGVAIELRINRE